MPKKSILKSVTQFQTALSDWYRQHHRKLPWRETACPYQIWVSEVMLQQTQVKTVLRYYHPFLAAFPDVGHLARTDTQAVLKAWEGLGYYARARNFHRAAQIVCDRHNGLVPSNPADFQKLPGVGDYIAAAVQSIVFNRPLAVADGNVKRVLARLNQMPNPVNQASSYRHFKAIATQLLDTTQPGQFNQAMMELGATVCRPQKPDCDNCPVQSFCQVFENNRVDKYPRRTPSKPIPEYHIAVGVVSHNGRLLITRRADHGLLGGLWEFPGGKVCKHETAENACIREIREEVNLEVKILSYITQVKHAYTHFKIVMDVFHCLYLSGKVKLNSPVDYKWITSDEISNYPFPKANHKFIRRIFIPLLTF
ncbi:A/G-specific adenine glycosylase [Desulfococcaceae bacterium HSG9]|nr:A/G-specific adenine glycosylase [Desulfococcaceae bacterium HSG9]